MKKNIFILCLVFALCQISIISYGQRNMSIEIQMDGGLIAGANGLTKSDVKITMVRKTTIECTKTPADLPSYTFACTPKFQLFNFNLDVFNSCGGYATGDKIEITIQVINSSHPLAGYKGTAVLIVQANSSQHTGENGINLVGTPELKINVPDLALCTGVAGSVTATVTADVPYKVTWSGGINASGTDGVTGTIPASLAAGKYTATVTTADGTASKDFQLTRNLTPAKPTLTQDPGSICLNESVTLTATTTTPGAVTYVLLLCL